MWLLYCGIFLLSSKALSVSVGYLLSSKDDKVWGFFTLHLLLWIHFKNFPFFWIFHKAKFLPSKSNTLKNDKIQMNVLTSGSLIAICETVEGPLSTFSTIWWALFISHTFNNAWNTEVEWGIICFLQQGKGAVCVCPRGYARCRKWNEINKKWQITGFWILGGFINC